ncbi:MAG: LysM peptidoglycan-binding domain-containing protein [Actinobacteria bacterium]|nr:LysM peptidoglycan-binding domain-containing protein [Actinomycetota bacterium]
MTPEVTVIEVLRTATVVLAVYLCAVVTLGIALRIVGANLLAAALDRVTPALARRVVTAALGVSLVVPSVASANEEPVVMRRLPDTETAAPSTTTSTAPRGVAAPLPVPRRVQTVEPSSATWTVKPGEHFWAIAERVMTAARQRPPTAAEVVPYWKDLIAANRSRLRDPSNANLVYPGQVLVLPPPRP